MLVLSLGLVPPVWSAPVGGKLPDAHTITITVSRDEEQGETGGKKNVITGGGPKDITLGGGPKDMIITTGDIKDIMVGGKKTGGGSKASGKLPDAHTITITVTRDKKKPISGKKPKEVALPGGGPKDITIGDPKDTIIGSGKGDGKKGPKNGGKKISGEGGGLSPHAIRYQIETGTHPVPKFRDNCAREQYKSILKKGMQGKCERLSSKASDQQIKVAEFVNNKLNPAFKEWQAFKAETDRRYLQETMYPGDEESPEIKHKRKIQQRLLERWNTLHKQYLKLQKDYASRRELADKCWKDAQLQAKDNCKAAKGKKTKTLDKAQKASDTAGCGNSPWQNTHVPGTACPFFAHIKSGGVPARSDTLPAAAPVAIALPETARKIELRVSGSVGHPGSEDFAVSAEAAYLRHGVAGVTAPINSLIGVFDVGAAWHPLALHHFRDGDGRTRSLDIPQGARHLYLGVMDGYGWYNNTGSYAVEYRFSPVPLAPDGQWKTSEGEMNIQSDGEKLNGHYNQDSGRLLMELQGQRSAGFWVEKDSDQPCSTPKNGSHHWGRAIFNFDTCFRHFSGWWSYCDSKKTVKAWTGTKSGDQSIRRDDGASAKGSGPSGSEAPRQATVSKTPMPKNKASERNRADSKPLQQGKSGTTGGASRKNAGGAGSGGGQVVIPVRGGSSRKHVGIPVKAKPARQKPEKPVQWTAYKLESFAGRNGGLPKMNVIKIAFRRSAKLAQLHVKSYPVSLSRNDRTGEILWSVNWSNGEIKDQRLASSPATIRNLSDLAEEKRKGAVAKSALAALIGRQLGPKARHL